MINQIYTIISDEVNPYKNLALEEFLLHSLKQHEVIMYLWQNKNTVVIGKNQNARAECKVEALRADNGFLARRPSGGGAVFHDLGNLNFTFLAKENIYDVEKQVGVILKAVQSLGLHAQKSGRNDIAIDGRKFSGNAFYTSRDNKFHHGTILLSADMTKLANYLTVSADKLKSHGVKSVKSRVVNLCELNPDITVNAMKSALITAFEEVYKLSSTPLPSNRVSESELLALCEKYSSDEWLYGAERAYNYTLCSRFEWGGAQLALAVEKARISTANFFTDALNDKLSDIVSDALTGKVFDKAQLLSALDTAKEKYEQAAVELECIKKLINENLE